MTFRTRIWLAMATAAVAPLLVLGWLSSRSSREEIRGVVGRLETQNALELAHGCERFVSNGVANLRLAVSYLPFDALDRAETGAVLALPYRQLPFVNVVALLDERGDALAPPLYEPNPERHPELAGHEPVTEADLEVFAQRVPLAAALASGVAVGPPYRPSPSRPARLAVAVRVDGQRPRVVAAELSLAELQARVEAVRAAGLAAFLVDGRGGLLAHSEAAGGLEAPEQQLVADGLKAAAPTARTLHRAGEDWLATFVPVQPLGWGIVVAERAAVAFRGAQRVRDFTLLWALLALGLAVGLGAVLARGLSRPIRAISQVAQRATEGAYQSDPRIEGADEIGQFGRAFNHMIDEVQRRDQEIRSWNEQLQQRVDERTAELKAAQDQILRTRRLAAIGSLGAGVAHELNNPLTSVIGMATVVKKGLGPEHPHLAAVETLLTEAKRAARIVTDLRQFATREYEGAGQRFGLASPVSVALEQMAERLREGKVALRTALPQALPDVQGDPVQIQQLVTHLVQNALNAMPAGGSLEVGVGAVEGEAVKLWVTDTGKGIAPELKERIFDPFFSTKERPTQLGMGLPLCHSIVEAHHGKIAVESAVNVGTTVTVLLPAAPPAGHLY